LDVDNGELEIILNGCRQNDRLNQTKLFHLLERFALRICYRYHGNPDEVADVMSESFFKLFSNLESFDISRCVDPGVGLKAWFKRILINTCIDHLRKQSLATEKSIRLGETEDFVAMQEDGFDRMAYKQIIESIQLLSPAYRTVFNLHVIEGMKHEEIAGLLGITVGASKSNLSKARNHLRSILLNRNKCINIA
jgi:RNA polymerase sigma factor (sigma-70 family)